MKRFIFAALAAIVLAGPADAQLVQPKTPVSLFGHKEHQQNLLLQKQMHEQNTARLAALEAQNQMLIQHLLNQQKNAPAPQQPPINIFIPQQPPQGQQQLPLGPPQQKLPLGPPQQQLPLGPPQQQLPLGPPQQPLPLGPPQQQLPLDPSQQQFPMAPQQQQLVPQPKPPGVPGPGTGGPPQGYQRYTTPDRPPVITGKLTPAPGARPPTIWVPK